MPWRTRAVEEDHPDLGCEGHISQLRRTRVGNFGAAQAVPISRIEETEDKAELLALLQPVQAVLDDIPQLTITRGEAANVRQGREIQLMPHLVEQWRAERVDDDRAALVICDGHAVAMGEVRAGRFEPARVFVA